MKNLLIIKKSPALAVTILLTLMILLTIVESAIAQEARQAPGSIVPTTVPSQGPGPSDPAELEAFLDELFAMHMEEYHIAGAAISVVKDGKLFFAKGYGYADLEQGIPVDPQQTIFGVGSVGKTFTWTAVMQLVEQGKLDLEADINTYLDFQIPNTYPEPITLKHLITHTSGFEDRWLGSAVLDESDLLPVREFLVSHMSARVRPPGYAGYSNYNAMLAGYIVGRVSGQPYDLYIQEHIFDPLGMHYSTVQFLAPPGLRPYASRGYTFEEGGFQAFPAYFTHPAVIPSGSHQASVADMARFMIALLGEGSYSDGNLPETRILEGSTTQQMFTTLYSPDRRLRGTAYGLFDWSDNGQRTLGHTGYLPPMNSVLLLLPDQDLGVFVVYNSAGGGDLTVQHSGFQRAFFDHYYPAPAIPAIQPPADFEQRAGWLVGSYNTSSLYTTLVKFAGLFGGGYAVEISNPGDGALLFSLMGQELRFVEVEPLYFRQVDGPFALVFREDDRGRITHMFTDLLPQYAELRLAWYETPGFNMALVLVCLLIFLSMIPVGLIYFIRERRLGGDRKFVSSGPRTAYLLLLGTSVLNLVFVIGLQMGVGQIESNILLGASLLLKIVLGLGVLSAVLTASALAYLVLAWKNSYWGRVGRAYYTLVTVAAVAFVWFLNYWNLLGWRY